MHNLPEKPVNGGVVGVDGGCDVESPPAVTTAVLVVSPVKGDMVFDGNDRTISCRQKEALYHFLIASLYARWMACRFDWSKLSAKEIFFASISSGTFALGHLIMKLTHDASVDMALLS